MNVFHKEKQLSNLFPKPVDKIYGRENPLIWKTTYVKAMIKCPKCIVLGRTGLVTLFVNIGLCRRWQHPWVNEVHRQSLISGTRPVAALENILFFFLKKIFKKPSIKTRYGYFSPNAQHSIMMTWQAGPTIRNSKLKLIPVWTANPTNTRWE